jgi:hypothetical protein
MRRMLGRPRMALLSMTTIVIAMLLGGTAGVAVAEPAERAESEIVFDVGNGITGSVFPETQSVRLTTPVPLIYDSRDTLQNRSGFGRGWTFGAAFIEISESAWFYLPEFNAHFEYDPNEPTGLRGYPGIDVRADFVGSRLLPGRGSVPEREYSWTLRHVETRTMEYFSSSGDVIALIDEVTEARKDWVWQAGDDHRLARLVNEAGQVTRLESDWETGRHTFIMSDGQSVFVGTDPRLGVLRLFGATQRTYFSPEWDGATHTRILTEDPFTVYPLEYLFTWRESPPQVTQLVRRINPELGWQLIWQVDDSPEGVTPPR